MNLSRAATLVVGIAIACMAHAQQAVVHMSVIGEVGHPGAAAFEGNARLADAVKAAEVNRNAYVLGAAWLRPERLPEQTRLKAGLTFELGVIRQQALARRQDGLADLAQRLHDWIGALPVTGRQVVNTLEPHMLQVSAADNLPLHEGDLLIYPSRPDSVRVVGAVEHPCELPHAALQDVQAYIARCPVLHAADPNLVYVVEPDGTVLEHGIALWNRSLPQAVAPGAVVYVPLDTRSIAHAADDSFNREMAEFIATQPLSGPGAAP